MQPIDELSTKDLQIIETHRAIIERDSNEISGAWKAIPIFLHLISAVCGYACSILFYIFWQDIFGLNCPIWANLEPPIHTRKLRQMGSEVIEEEGAEIFTNDWRKRVIITFKHNIHCQFFFFVTLCSCAFGIIWLMLFSRCGKGGYDTRIFTAPWRIVPPAVIFHLIFSPILLAVVHDFAYGYWNFTKNLKKVASTYLNHTEMAKFQKHCEIVSYYLEVYDINRYNNCYVQTAIEVLAWTMAWSWLITLTVLILRVITVTDFRFLITRIYKLPPRPKTPPEPIVSGEPKLPESPVKRQRIKKIIFAIPERERKAEEN